MLHERELDYAIAAIGGATDAAKLIEPGFYQDKILAGLQVAQNLLAEVARLKERAQKLDREKHELEHERNMRWMMNPASNPNR